MGNNNSAVFVISPSLYGMLHGEDPLADKLLSILSLSRDDFGRFRDVHLNEDGSQIIARTRTGGGNRDAYESSNDALACHPLYLGDEDDDFDSTYAYFHFRMPEELRDWARSVATGKPVEGMWELTQKAIAAMTGSDKQD